MLVAVWLCTQCQTTTQIAMVHILLSDARSLASPTLVQYIVALSISSAILIALYILCKTITHWATSSPAKEEESTASSELETPKPLEPSIQSSFQVGMASVAKTSLDQLARFSGFDCFPAPPLADTPSELS